MVHTTDSVNANNGEKGAADGVYGVFITWARISEIIALHRVHDAGAPPEKHRDRSARMHARHARCMRAHIHARGHNIAICSGGVTGEL